MTTVEVLRAARAKIDTPEKWVKGHYAATAGGECRCNLSQRSAGDVARHCSVGALSSIPGGPHNEAIRVLALSVPGDRGLSSWQDDASRTHPEVLKVFDDAIELALLGATKP